MQTTLTKFLKTSVPLTILRKGYEVTDCECFNAFVTDETTLNKKTGKAKRVRVKFYTCPMHRNDPPEPVNIDLDNLPEGFPLSRKNAFIVKQRKMLKERREQLLKFKEEHGELLDQVATELNQEIANDNNTGEANV